MYECVIEIVIVNDRLKCQLSGGTLQGAGSPLNLIKRHLCCVVDQKPHIRYICTVEPLYLFLSLMCLNIGRVRNIVEIP